MRTLLVTALVLLGRWITPLLFRLHIEGWENLPRRGPLLLISNHFSFFEPFLVASLLPYSSTFMAAEELRAYWPGRVFFATGRIIPIRRGAVDRQALRAAGETLAQGGVLALWPEGGIRQDLMAQTARGEQVHAPLWESSRLPATLLPPRAGVAYLATKSPVPVLPIAFIGTEHTLNNLRRLRRTTVSMIIGAPFGPLHVSPELRGAERRAALDALSIELMRAIAALMPRRYRGPYAED
jgi:1-acyl-sn-glycerol-3-phosphate acyltransferase